MDHYSEKLAHEMIARRRTSRDSLTRVARDAGAVLTTHTLGLAGFEHCDWCGEVGGLFTDIIGHEASETGSVDACTLCLPEHIAEGIECPETGRLVPVTQVDVYGVES